MTYNYSDISLGEFPNEVSLILYSGSCVCRCPWCFNSDLLKLKPLSFKQMKDAIDTHEDFITAVVFSGGEPLLNPYLRKIIKYAKDKGLKIKLNTCGLVDKTNYKNVFLPYLDHINISLKGTQQMTIDVLKLSNPKPMSLHAKVIEYSFVYSPTIYPQKVLKSFHEYLKRKITHDDIFALGGKWSKPDIFTISQMQTGNCFDSSYNDCRVPTKEDCIKVATLFSDIPKKNIIIETLEFGRKKYNINKL